MITLRNLIIYTTFPAIFSSACYLAVGGIDLQLFYFVMIFNLWLMFCLGTIWIPRGLVVLVGLIGLSGTTGILRGTDSTALFAKNFFGISISALYFCSFLRLLNFDIEYCFRIYARLAYYVALIGFALLPFQAAAGRSLRLQSVLTEPSMFAVTCLPALFYYTDRWQQYRLGGRELIVLALAFAAAGSSVGFLGIIVGLLMFGTRYRFGWLLLPALATGLGLFIYVVSSDFRLRLDDTVKSAQTLDVEGVNVSTFALVTNAFVARQEVTDHPFLGGGIGSHIISYRHFIDDQLGIDLWENSDAMELNAADGNSLLLRALSETGILGVLLISWFIWYYHRPGNDKRAIVSKSIVMYFFVKLLRSGHYFSPEQFFFIVIYATNGGPFHRHSPSQKAMAPPPNGLGDLLPSAAPGSCPSPSHFEASGGYIWTPR
jgi:hypothetical protein